MHHALLGKAYAVISHGVNMPPGRTNVPPDATAGKNRFLLVVDSDHQNLLHASLLLRRFGYDVRVAGTAAEALTIVTEARPALVITSLTLQDMHSLELLRLLGQNTGLAPIPFFIMKTHDELLEARDCFQHGVAGCLALPIAVEELYRAVQEIVERRPRRDIRVKTLLPIQAASMPHDCYDNACTTDLSERGMFVRSAKPADVHTRLSCWIDLCGQRIEVEAAVQYNNRTIEGACAEPGMGLEFVRIAPKDQKLIRQFVRSEVTRGIVPCTL